MSCAGWQALWHISRAHCEELNKLYPTIVVGTVNKVNFDKLQAEFVVSENDGAGIGSPQTVPLEELWPTKQQSSDALNASAKAIARCIDLLRY